MPFPAAHDVEDYFSRKGKPDRQEMLIRLQRELSQVRLRDVKNWEKLGGKIVCQARAGRGDTDELPKVVDFGLAKFLSTSPQETIDTDPGQAVGTMRYALHEALLTSWKSAEAGRLQPASRILDELRRQR